MIDSDKLFRADIIRTFTLRHYIENWGMPKFRRVMRKKDVRASIEAYFFPADENNSIARLSSVGVSDVDVVSDVGASKHGCEYFMTLPGNLEDNDIDDILEYFLNLIAHFLGNGSNVIPRVLGNSRLAPNSWKLRAVFVDEPRGEKEDFASLMINKDISVNFAWIVPLYNAEADLILSEGVEAFDDLYDAQDLSLADISRPCFVKV